MFNRRSALATLFAALVIGGAFPVLAFGQANWEYSPYQVRVWIAAEPHPQFPAALQDEIGHELSARAQAVCGAVWELAVESSPPAALAALPETLNLPVGQLQKLAPEVMKNDKLLVVRIAPGSLGWEIEAREFDCH